MHFAFDRLRLERISSVIHPQNAASIRVAEKLGMRGTHDADQWGRRRDLLALR